MDSLGSFAPKKKNNNDFYEIKKEKENDDFLFMKLVNKAVAITALFYGPYVTFILILATTVSLALG